jgi:hypothetical protein
MRSPLSPGHGAEGFRRQQSFGMLGHKGPEIGKQLPSIQGQIVPMGASHNIGKGLTRPTLSLAQLFVSINLEADGLDGHALIMHDRRAERQALPGLPDCAAAARTFTSVLPHAPRLKAPT